MIISYPTKALVIKNSTPLTNNLFATPALGELLNQYTSIETALLSDNVYIAKSTQGFSFATLVEVLSTPTTFISTANSSRTTLESLRRGQAFHAYIKRTNSVARFGSCFFVGAFSVNASAFGETGIQSPKTFRVFSNRTLPTTLQRYNTKVHSLHSHSVRWPTGAFPASKSGSFPIISDSIKSATLPANLKLWFTTPSGINHSVRQSDVQSLLSFLTGSRVSLYRVNALSLTRYAFESEAKQFFTPVGKLSATNLDKQVLGDFKSSGRFLRSLEQERVSRFQYVAIYIQDLVRISFVSIYLKKADVLAKFLAFTLSKLPRNRKETQFLRFLSKVVKVFASQRKERIGLRLRFQGRVNR